MTRIAFHPRNRRTRCGAALVEMALVLPIFLAVVLGIIEFGRAMMVGQLVTNAAREGARLAILDGATNADVEAYIVDFLETSANVSAEFIDVSVTIEPAPGNNDPGGQLANAGPRDLVTVRVEVPFDEVNYLPSKHLADRKLVGQASMRHE